MYVFLSNVDAANDLVTIATIDRYSFWPPSLRSRCGH